MGPAAGAATLLFDGAAFRAHPVGRTVRVATLLVRTVTGDALERRAQPALPPLGGDHPLSLLPGRAVTDVLPMAALEQRHPVPDLVLLEAHDAAPHRLSLVARRRRPPRPGGRGGGRAAPVRPFALPRGASAARRAGRAGCWRRG